MGALREESYVPQREALGLRHPGTLLSDPCLKLFASMAMCVAPTDQVGRLNCADVVGFLYSSVAKNSRNGAVQVVNDVLTLEGADSRQQRCGVCARPPRSGGSVTNTGCTTALALPFKLTRNCGCLQCIHHEEPGSAL